MWVALVVLLLVQTPSGAPKSPSEQRADECWKLAETDTEAAFKLAEAALPEAQAALAGRAVAELRLCRGYGHEGADRPDAAMKEYEFVVAEGARLRDDALRADALVLRGEMRHSRGEFDAALEDLQLSYRLNVSLGRGSKERYALNAIANVYADANVGDYDRALEYYRQLLAADEKSGLLAEAATAHFNIGSTLDKKGDQPSALVHLQRALDLERKRGDPEQIAYCERSVAIALTKLGRPGGALRLLQSALTSFEVLKDADMIAATRLSRGVALRGLGRPAQALADLEAARVYFEAQKDDRFLEKIHDEQAQALAAEGRWPDAYAAQRAHDEVQRRLSEGLKQEHASRLRVQFDAERKEQENRALLRESALQNRVLLLALGLVLVLGYLLFRRLADARRLRVMAMTDELTRLPNRRHLLALAEEAVAVARRSGGPLCVLALDVDRFKRINDSLGHAVGDTVLQRVAHTCRTSLRPQDQLGRIGGEEFAVLLPRTTAAEAGEISERLRAALAGRDFRDLGPDLAVTISGGIAQWRAADGGFAGLLSRADAALYRAKESGRNRIETAPPP